MNSQLLSLFAHVARSESFTSSAKELGMTRPGISARIRQLETECGVALLERAGRGIQLTPAGACLLEYADRVAQVLAEAQMAMEQFRSDRMGTVRVATGHTSGHLDLPTWLTTFERTAPGVTVKPIICNTGETIEHILAGRAELGIIGNPPEHPRIHQEHVYDEELVFACGESIASPTVTDSELFPAETFGASIIRSKVFLVREKNSGTRALAEKILRDLNIAPKKWMELSNENAIFQATKMGMGVAMLPRRLLDQSRSAHRLTELRLTENPILMKCSVVYSKMLNLGKEARAFADLIASYYARLSTAAV